MLHGQKNIKLFLMKLNWILFCFLLLFWFLDLMWLTFIFSGSFVVNFSRPLPVPYNYSQFYSATVNYVNGVGGDSMLTNGSVLLLPKPRTVCVRTIINKGEKGTNCATTPGMKYRSCQHVLVPGKPKRRM